MKCKYLITLMLVVCTLGVAYGDSLWVAKGGDHLSMFADRKASRVGDILTVVVNITDVATSTQSKQSGRTSSVTDALGQFLFPNLGAHAGALPSISYTGKTAYTGGGAVTNSEKLTSTTAVMVTDVLPNGNMVIEGIRQVTFSGETQYIVLHGIVRPDDITSADTVSSSSIAQSRIEFVNSGTINDSEKLGLLARLYETLHPL
jgi:flagellar L-ring protein FlgH